MPNFVLPFSKISKKDVKKAGGKGASLGEMTGIKLPVPPGFVVLANAFEKYLKDTDINVEIEAALDKVSVKDVNSVERTSSKIRDLIHDFKVSLDIKKQIEKAFDNLKSKFVAVRSSATAEDSKIASWAGELETYLFVDKKNLMDKVRTCWSSLYTPRAIFYRFEKGLHKRKVGVAVVVQDMIDSEVSGVAFTVHPVTRDKNQMVIEAVLGQGEAIVSGQVTPDTYVIDKEDDYIVDINISEQKEKIAYKKNGGTKKVKIVNKDIGKQKLSGQEIIGLSKICSQIEKHYRHPQDIEWARAKNKFYITQSRPITTL
ncbi:MAG: PEP/pyruvate-binding domain-containing protein [Patescibacteria group bacterium]|nr:PEP/pyruvate-binding domain-containing protein [Patescibacteria group bacterium]MDZ7799069.1 PEP/pyruvate-binding domain-containing protein [Patescibacteria group bacterium]